MRDSRLVSSHAEFWARHPRNLDLLREKFSHHKGVYVLYNGLTPVYIGHGEISRRILRHDHSRTKGTFWDHFSWYEIAGVKDQREVETLLLRLLPVYLHMLNRQRAKFIDSSKIEPVLTPNFELKRPKYGAGSRRHGTRNKPRN
jgi:hypothetical protein